MYASSRDNHRPTSHYAVLQVHPAASAAVLQAAYRCLMQLHHPDKNPGQPRASVLASQINQAYAVLSDPVSRRAYDHALAGQSSPQERRLAPESQVCGPLHSGAVGWRPYGFRPLSASVR